MGANPIDLVLTVHNRHFPECGKPPAVIDDGRGDVYIGYFTNSFGEQWLVQIDRQNRVGTLRGGDLGWDEEIPIQDGEILGDIILGDEEAVWLALCWKAAI